MSEKCIIFDCDGVLVDSERVANHLLAEMVQPYGVEMTGEEATARFTGSNMAAVLAVINEKADRPLPDDFASLYREKMHAAFETDLLPIEGVADALEAIPNPKCVASSGPIAKMDVTLSVTDLKKHFEGRIFSSYEIDSWKPEPDLFLHAAKEMGFRPADCIVVEDSPLGVRAGVAAGMRVLCYCEGDGGEAMRKLGATVFQSMTDLPPLIESLN